MYCVKCGSELPPDASFCTKCGAAVYDVKANAAAANGVAAGTSGHAAASGANAEIPSAANSQYATSSEGPATPDASNVNLRDAVRQTTKRSHRRVPIVVLVALAMALATGVAYAAYRVYVDVIQPWQQSMQQEEAVESQQPEEESGDQASDDSAATEAEEEDDGLPSGLHDGWWRTFSSENTYYHFHDGKVDVYLSESQNGQYVPYDHDADYTYDVSAEHTDSPGIFDFGAGWLIRLSHDSVESSVMLFVPDSDSSNATCVWQESSGEWQMSGSDSLQLDERPEQLSSN